MSPERNLNDPVDYRVFAARYDDDIFHTYID